MKADACRSKQVRGESIPALGLGTRNLYGAECRRLVCTAINLGYRHLDTASIFDNQEEVGYGISDSRVPRDGIFLSSKIWNAGLDPVSIRKQVQDSLRALKVDYLDLVVIHWPNPDYPLNVSIEVLESLRGIGLLKQYGVCDFTPEWLSNALEWKSNLFCNQVEYHPLMRRRRLLDLAVDYNLLLIAHSPLGQGQIRHLGLIDSIAQKYRKLPEQIALRWILEQPNMAAVPGSTNVHHIAQNLDIFDFFLDDEDNDKIANLPDGEARIDPVSTPFREYQNS